jgi:hypothetical protein
MNILITDNQHRTIINALYAATEKYRECAREIGASDLPQAPRDSLVAQFKKQSDECAELLQVLED